MIPPIASISWPATLPLPLLNTSGGNPNPPTVVSDIRENSRIQRRRRFSSLVPEVNFRWHFTIGQMDEFETFYADTLGNGAAQFLIELRYPKISEMNLWLVRFLGGYTQEYDEGFWRVSAQLQLIRTSIAEAAPLVGWTSFLVEQEGFEDDETMDVPFITSDDRSFNVKV